MDIHDTISKEIFKKRNDDKLRNQEILSYVGINSNIKNKEDLAFSYHLIYHLQKLMKHKSEDELKIFIENINDYSNHLSGDNVKFIDKANCIKYKDTNFLDPIYVINDANKLNNVKDNYMIQSTLNLLEYCGYNNMLNMSLANIVLLENNNTPSRSYTIKQFPMTIFTDYEENPIIFAENIIHEVGHCNLNDIFNSFNIDLDSNIYYYSPWKKTQRPLFGFLHAIWSFSVVTNYYKKIEEKFLSDSDRAFVEFRIQYEKSRLISSEQDLISACSYINNHVVKEYIVDQYTRAIG